MTSSIPSRLSPPPLSPPPPADAPSRHSPGTGHAQASTTLPAPRILIQGVGGIGGTIAARLIHAAYSVTCVTGNARLAEALNRDGFQVDGLAGTLHVRPVEPVVADVPEDTPAFDLLLLATPPNRLEAALAASSHRLAKDAQVVCLSNGLPEDRAARFVAPEAVVGCVVGWGANMPTPGHYTQTSLGQFQLGRPWGPSQPPRPTSLPLSESSIEDEGLRLIASILSHIAPVTCVHNLTGVRWSKLAISSAITTLGAVGGDRLGKLMRHRFVRRLALEVFTEVARVGTLQGHRLEKVNGTLDIERIALTPGEQRSRMGSATLLYKHSILFAVGLKFRRMRSSMLYALERGRDPGVECLNGEIVSRGMALGIETPVNRALLEAVQQIAAGKKASGLETLRQVYHNARLPRAQLSSRIMP